MVDLTKFGDNWIRILTCIMLTSFCVLKHIHTDKKSFQKLDLWRNTRTRPSFRRYYILFANLLIKGKKLNKKTSSFLQGILMRDVASKESHFNCIFTHLLQKLTCYWIPFIDSSGCFWLMFLRLNRFCLNNFQDRAMFMKPVS